MGDNLYLVLSLLLLALSIYLYRKTRISLINRYLFSVLVFVFVIFYSFYGISDYFTGNGIDDSVLYHIKYGLGGAGFSEYWKIIVATFTLIVFSLCLSCWSFLKRNNKEDKSNRVVNIYTTYLFISASLLFNPALYDAYSLLSNSSVTSARQIEDSRNSDFKTFYEMPYIKREIEDSSNLVFIYAESLERTYFDETIFPGLIKGLRGLESTSTYFTDIKQVTGTGWTIGGMVASQCGIPLFTPSHGNSMSGMDKFLVSAVCLGDLLHNEGYQLTYYGGASRDFAGKGKFYSTHKFDDISGRDKLGLELPNKEYHTGWGLFDDSLFDLAYRRFIELSASEKKIGLFLLTLDTHHPIGHPSKSCQGKIYQDGSNPMLNAVACSDYLITEFVNKVMQSPYGDKTIVVVASDHLALRNTASHLLRKGKRTNLFMIIGSDMNKPAKINTKGSTLDIGPTILPFLGFKGSVGLGRNLMDNSESLTSDIQYIQSNLKTWQPSISGFWNFPRIMDSVEIDIANKKIKIDDREFNMPILVELSSELETTLKFQFDSSPGHQELIDHILALDINKPYIWLDKCANVNVLVYELGQSGFCMVAGKGDRFSVKTKIDKNMKFTSEQIKKFTLLR